MSAYETLYAIMKLTWFENSQWGYALAKTEYMCNSFIPTKCKCTNTELLINEDDNLLLPPFSNKQMMTVDKKNINILSREGTS